jgi:hypothetical protein
MVGKEMLLEELIRPLELPAFIADPDAVKIVDAHSHDCCEIFWALQTASNKLSTSLVPAT